MTHHKQWPKINTDTRTNGTEIGRCDIDHFNVFNKLIPHSLLTGFNELYKLQLKITIIGVELAKPRYVSFTLKKKWIRIDQDSGLMAPDAFMGQAGLKPG